MKIIDCDFHTRYQQIAMMDEATGGLMERAGGTTFEVILKLRAGGPAFDFSGWQTLSVFEGLCFDFSVCLHSMDGIDADRAALQNRVERKAAPRPVARMIDQFSLQRIHVRVVNFFNLLFQVPDSVPEGSK